MLPRPPVPSQEAGLLCGWVLSDFFGGSGALLADAQLASSSKPETVSSERQKNFMDTEWMIFL